MKENNSDVISIGGSDFLVDNYPVDNSFIDTIADATELPRGHVLKELKKQNVPYDSNGGDLPPA